MERVIKKANVLIEALPFIQRFHGERIVVKFGGSIMEKDEAVGNILKDIAFMACVGLRPVIVHGGGKAISRSMQAAGIAPDFIKGLRVTDEASVRIVEHVLNHEVNPKLVGILEDCGCKARGIHGDDMLHVVPKEEKDPETGEPVRWGYVGIPESVDVEPVNAYLDSGITPVITPLGRGADRHVYNVNADDSAAAVAQGLKARKLVFLSDVPGLLEDRDNPESLLSTVHASDVDDLIRRKIIQGGMLPKIQGGVDALRAGVHKIHIIDSSLPHSLLLELFTEQGVGTEIIL